MADISTFKSRMTGGGFRQNQFQVVLPSIPGYNYDTTEFTILVKAASIPEASIADVSLSYKGKKAHFAGEREFQSTWQTTAYLDTNFEIRDALEYWQSMISNFSTTNGETNVFNYQIDGQVSPMTRGGKIIKTYNMISMWPSKVGSINLDQETENQIATFEIDWTYDYFQPNIAKTGALII